LQVNIKNLIDDGQCYQTIRELRWPEGIECPSCQSKHVMKRGFDDKELARQRYELSLSRLNHRLPRGHPRNCTLGFQERAFTAHLCVVPPPGAVPSCTPPEGWERMRLTLWLTRGRKSSPLL
jgi:hypothetical protein